MLPWSLVAVLYVLGAGLMALYAREVRPRLTVRSLIVILFWAPVTFAAAFEALFIPTKWTLR